MTYKKPDNITYTQMCIYIDEHIYSGDYDEETVYKYLYLLVYMLAKQAQLFNKHKYYDGFAIFGATRVYFRLTNKRQFELNKDGQPKMKKISSVLNYLHKILYYLKIDYEQEEYAQSISREVTDNLSYNYDNIIRSSLDGIHSVEFDMTLNDISRTCKKFLSTIPYKKNSKEWLNIYVSVMLTLLNVTTLRNKSKKRIDHLSSTGRLKDSHIDQLFLQEKYSEPILFHLDSSMKDYITVLTRQLKRIVAEDLSDILHTKVQEDSLLVAAVADDFLVNQGDFNEDRE